MKAKINANGTEITIISKGDENDYISLTDIARYKNPDEPKDVVKNWMRLCATIEFVGLWEQLNNSDFKGVEFDSFKNEAGSNAFTYANKADMLNVALFGKTAKEWRNANPKVKGNMRDEATIQQLIVLSNLESMNAELIKQGLLQNKRLLFFNKMAIEQMKSIIDNQAVKQLQGTTDEHE